MVSPNLAFGSRRRAPASSSSPTGGTIAGGNHSTSRLILAFIVGLLCPNPFQFDSSSIFPAVDDFNLRHNAIEQIGVEPITDDLLLPPPGGNPEERKSPSRDGSRDRSRDGSRDHSGDKQEEERPPSGSNDGKNEEEQEDRNSQDEEQEKRNSQDGDKSASGDSPPEEGEKEGPWNDFADLNAPVADWDLFKHLDEISVKEPKVSFLEPSKCPSYLEKISVLPPKVKEPSIGACDGYDGVVRIKSGDMGAAAGTVFFIYVVAMLQWADQHNYKPWVHLDDYSFPIHDPKVHTTKEPIKMVMQEGWKITEARTEGEEFGYLYPGKPALWEGAESVEGEFEFPGTGIWNHYFEPVSNFSPGDESCKGKPLVEIMEGQLSPGLHMHAPWTPKAWRIWMPDYLQRLDLSYDDWFEPMRRNASLVVKRYIRFKSTIQKRAQCVLPLTNSTVALGIHIRHGDKWIERTVIPVSLYLPYVEAFVNRYPKSGMIYLATDSKMVVDEIFKTWPKNITKLIYRQTSVKSLTTDNHTASFEMKVGHHEGNVEALTDILALSKCNYLIHGLSAFTEAAFYLNPKLIDRSVNIDMWQPVYDIDRLKTVEDFVKMMPAKKSKLPSGSIKKASTPAITTSSSGTSDKNVTKTKKASTTATVTNSTSEKFVNKTKSASSTASSSTN